MLCRVRPAADRARRSVFNRDARSCWKSDRYLNSCPKALGWLSNWEKGDVPKGVQAEATLALVLHLHGHPPEGAGSSYTSRRCQLKPAWFLCRGRVTLLLWPSCKLLMQCLRSDSGPAILGGSSCTPSRTRNGANSRQASKNNSSVDQRCSHTKSLSSCLIQPNQAAAPVVETPRAGRLMGFVPTSC